MRDKKKIISIILFCFLLCVGIYISFTLDQKRPNEVDATEKSDILIPEIWKVDIKGAVINPGVYEVSDGDRVSDVIEKAGGLAKGANTTFINLGKRVFDEMIIWIYTDKEIDELKLSLVQYIEKECNCPSVKNSACLNNGEMDDKVNINTANLDQLMTLPGIGEVKAKAIIEYREKNIFKTIEDIKNVSGIGDSAYEKIKDYITV